jgi:hypothetical protein
VAQDDRDMDRATPGARAQGTAPGAEQAAPAADGAGEGAATRSQHVVLTLRTTGG